MPFYHDLTDETGDTVDMVPFCCNNCHKDWCIEKNIEYPGDGFGEPGSDAGEWCAQCGVICSQPSDWTKCTCGWDNVVVNRFRVEETEVCEHGLTIQTVVVADDYLDHLSWVLLDPG